MLGFISKATNQYQTGTITADQFVAEASKTPLGWTPNPQRICNIIAMANTFGPMLGLFITGFVWKPIPLPSFCTTPAPPAATADLKEHRLLIRAIVSGLT